MYRIHQIRLRPRESKDKIPEKILKKIGRSDLYVSQWNIVRESIDARDKTNIWLVYSVDFQVVSKKNPKKNVRLPSTDKLKIEVAKEVQYDTKESWKLTEEERIRQKKLTTRPVVVGFGPAGIFAALILAEAGKKPLILERGEEVDKRQITVNQFWQEGTLNPQSNVQFGEGGAGAFSDGKLTTGINDTRIRKVLEEFVKAGAPEEILYKQKPHIGTDVLCQVVKTLRTKIIALGGEIKFNTQVVDLIADRIHGNNDENFAVNGGVGGTESSVCLTGIKVLEGDTGKEKIIPCQTAVFAIGHSARDTFRMLYQRGIVMKQKPFSIGVRIEHPQKMIDVAQYGQDSAILGLPVADYKLNWRCENGRGVYTFCMCPGGQVVVASSQQGGVVTNGMSYHARNSGIANSALLCDVRPEDFESDDVLAGVAFQEKYEQLAYKLGGENYQAPSSTWGQLRDGKAPQVEGCLPKFAVEAMREAMPHLGKKLAGFDREDARVTAVEARSSSPVRFNRNSWYEGEIQELEEGARDQKDSGETLVGFYPCGEGAGYAGGIMSAAVDGIRIAESIIKEWQTEEL